MFRSFLQWLRDQGAWDRDHVESWRTWTVPGPSGLSRLQQECEAELSSALRGQGATLEGRVLRTTDSVGTTVYARISPIGLDLWLHDDTVSLIGDGIDLRFEECDFRTPEEFVQRVAATVNELISRGRDGTESEVTGPDSLGT